MATPFRVIAEYGLRMARTRSRLMLRQLVAELLRRVAVEEIPAATRLLLGKAVPQGRALQMSGNAVWRAIEPIFGRSQAALGAYTAGAEDFGAGVRNIFAQLPKHAGICPEEREPLTIPEVHSILGEIAAIGGSGARTEKEVVLRELLCRADADEAMYLVKNIIGEMRHGVNEGLLLEGIALAAGVDQALVRRNFMLIGDVGMLAHLALTEGAAGLARSEIALFSPTRPMLAQAVDDVPAAWVQHGGQLALEYKLDGARVQVHLRGDEVRIYTRHLMEITASLPEVTAAVRAQIAAESAILEGEIVAVDQAGRALPFQELMRRFRRVRDVPRLLQEVPVRLYLFDVLYTEGQPLIEEPNAVRWARLQSLVSGDGLVHLVPRLVPRTVEEGAAFFDQAVDEGHEGLMAKRLDSVYAPGIRGAGWLKIKEALTVDLVIVAAEWGYGRRTGWLSNYHLAARDIVTGELVMVGKTFKGLTDQEFARMTEALMALRVGPHEHIIQVKPEIVVEVGFNQIQRSSSYPGGLALRFARIVRFRPDKTAEDIETVQTLRDLYTQQAGQPWAQAA